MADVWTTPRTWVTGEVISAAQLNQHVRDNLDALLQGLRGDASVDADIVQAVKAGTLAARPAASQAGRQYYATDTHQLFADSGTAWRLVSGGAYDDFFRANSSTITPSRSGHTWTESIGDWEINTNALKMVSGTPGVCLLNTGGVLDRSYELLWIFTTHSTAASIDSSVVVKAASSTNYIYIKLSTSLLDFRKVIASVDTSFASIATTATASGLYEARIVVAGNAVEVLTTLTGGGVLRAAGRDNDVLHANLAAANSVGVRYGNTVETTTLLSLQP